jgi:hypothetical protein
MARLHALIGWMVLVGSFTTMSVHAADKPLEKPFIETPSASVADKKAADADPFAGPSEKPVTKEPVAKKKPAKTHPFAGPAEKTATAKPAIKDKLAKKPKPASSVVKRRPAKAAAKKPHSFAHREMPVGGNIAAIERALASPAHLEFVDSPLQDVIDYLKDIYQIEIQLDRHVLEDMNIGGETPITINVKGITLKSALRQMFRDIQPELAYLIRDDVLLITTPDVCEEQLVTRVYPVGDLVTCRDEHDAPWEDYEALIDVIVSATGRNIGGTDHLPGNIKGQTLGTAKVLVVSQTEETHEEIADLLAKMREIAKHSPNGDPPRRSKLTPTPQVTTRDRLSAMHGEGMF